jgi:large subunit ribosomal protein L18
MNNVKKRRNTRIRKKAHIRKRISGDKSRPRITVYRSNNHIYVQAVDDIDGVTLVSASTRDEEVVKQIEGSTGNKAAAGITGKIFGQRLADGGYKTVVFDRNGFLFHGRIKSLADGIRKVGIKF